MKKFILIITCLVMTVASFAQVKADYDKDTNFESFQTYRIVGWEKDSDKILTPFDKERILNSIDTELSERGLAKVDANADMPRSCGRFSLLSQRNTCRHADAHLRWRGHRLPDGSRRRIGSISMPT